ncbi:MAG: hypothetical protein EPN48_15510 [Microbacteriaceae bacterium]|nr:MAG: hypothetical protein EPN48_15510 [Microbacteriaceae bacterium]
MIDYQTNPVSFINHRIFASVAQRQQLALGKNFLGYADWPLGASALVAFMRFFLRCPVSDSRLVLASL